MHLHTGVIASNGVNGDKASQQGLPAYGIVVCWCLLAAVPSACAFAKQATHMQGEFGLNLTQDGFLATAFMVRRLHLHWPI